MQPFLNMKSDRNLDINDVVGVRGLERSKLGVITHIPTNYKEIVIQWGETFNWNVKIGGINVN